MQEEMAAVIGYLLTYYTWQKSATANMVVEKTSYEAF